MVDTFRSCNRLLLRLWALWATRLRVVHKPTGLTGRIRWAPAETAAFAVDEAKLKIGETHLPLAAVGLGKTDLRAECATSPPRPTRPPSDWRLAPRRLSPCPFL